MNPSVLESLVPAHAQPSPVALLEPPAPRPPRPHPPAPTGRARDLAVLRATYLAQGELVFGADLVPPPVVAALYADACRVEPAAVRKYIPRFKKSASVSFHQLAESAPGLVDFYRSPPWLRFLEAIVDRRLETCPDRDAHACALYFYTEPGDHIGWHYDTSHYDGSRFTVLISLHDDSSARLLGHLFRDDPDRETVEATLPTPAGTCVIFNGDKLWHSVSPIAAGERRVVLSLEYVTDPRMGRWHRFVAGLKDAIAYFGFRQWISGGDDAPLLTPPRPSSARTLRDRVRAARPRRPRRRELVPALLELHATLGVAGYVTYLVGFALALLIGRTSWRRGAQERLAGV